MSNEQFASVWDAIEATPEAAENMKRRSGLMIALNAHLTGTGLDQSQAAQLFSVTQVRITDLMRGRINLFSLEDLVKMSAAAGLPVA